MNQKIRGKTFVLGDDIDTDQIIPAQHLVYSLTNDEERCFYGRFALSGVPATASGLPGGGVSFTAANSFRSEFKIIVGGKNFGCGSSREHAPAALQIAGVQTVIATSYARIFYRNAVDGGFLIPYESRENLTEVIQTGDEIEIDHDKDELRNLSRDQTFHMNPLGDVAEIVAAGGIFEYARKSGMI